MSEQSLLSTDQKLNLVRDLIQYIEKQCPANQMDEVLLLALHASSGSHGYRCLFGLLK